MNLIIYIHRTDKAAHFTFRVIQIYQTTWVSYARIYWIAISIECFIIATIVAITRIDRKGWIESSCCPNGTTIIKRVVVERSLGIDRQLQVILEEAWSQHHVTGPALHIVFANQTTLVVISSRNTERQILTDASTYAEVVICTESCAINLIIPISIGIAEQ